MIEDMTVRNFGEKTRNDYIRHVKNFTAFLARSPDTATAEDVRRFQLHQRQTGVRPPTINGSVVALRFFFTVTLGRANMARQLTFVREPPNSDVEPCRGTVWSANGRGPRGTSHQFGEERAVDKCRRIASRMHARCQVRPFVS
jgi:Phage integrase, N-terminal SAM-like domain